MHVNSFDDTQFRVEMPEPFGAGIYALDDSNARSMNFSYFDDPSAAVRPSTDEAILVSSEKLVSVTASASQAGTTGAYLALPITKSATEFFIPSWPSNQMAPSAFSVVTPADGGCAEVYKVTGGVYERVEFMHLSRLHVKHFRMDNGDYTGYFVNSTVPFAVVGGQECAYIPETIQYCDNIIEMVPPVSQLGTQFIMISPVGRNVSSGYIFRVIGTEDGTTVTGSTTDGKTFSANLSTGDFFQGEAGHMEMVPTITTLECSKPCLVVQYNPGYAYVLETKETDPYMQIIPPLDHWPKDAKFGTMNYYREMTEQGVIGNNHILIVMKKTELSSLTVNGKAPNPADWKDISAFGDTFSWHTQEVPRGYYEVLTANQEPFMVIASGHGKVDDEHTAWSYLGGYLSECMHLFFLISTDYNSSGLHFQLMMRFTKALGMMLMRTKHL